MSDPYKYATLKHLEEHKMKLRLVLDGWKPKWDVQCTCGDHYLHQRFGFLSFRKAWEVYTKW